MHVNTIISEPSVKIIKRNVNITVMPYQLLALLSPLGQRVGNGGDLTKQVIKYPTIWAG